MEKTEKSILVLEDEESTLTVLNEGLKKAGYKTFPFQRPDTACIQVLMKEKLDLILTDLGIFNFDAAQMIKFLKEKKIAQDIPVIIISGKTEQEIEKAAKELKAKDWVSKPFKLEAVLEKVKKVVG